MSKKTVTITINRCEDCPHFFMGNGSYLDREICRLYRRHPDYDIEKNNYLIPDWCKIGDKFDKLKGEIKTLKEQLNNTKHQYIPRNFEG